MIAKYSIRLDWKEHNVDLESLAEWLKDNAGEHYCGCSADTALTVWFKEEPSEEERDAVVELWDELDDEEHDLCTSYKSKEERDAEKDAAKVSARAKLAALGLSEAELAALLG